MADLIDRQALMSSKFECMVMTNADGTEAYLKWVDVANHINSFPAVDAVEVVRCKDCKHYERYDDEIEGVTWQGLCHYGEFFSDELDFCSRGERREDDA